jgi:hypothetical protein
MTPTDKMPPDAIATEFARFFQQGAMTTSYKTALLKGILYLLRNPATLAHDATRVYLAVDDVSRYFFRFYFMLHKAFQLRQLIIQKNFPSCLFYAE